MHRVNQTSISEFLLLEFSEVRELQILHFLLFLVFYLATVTGNLLIISAVAFDHHLHTPMYFFLMNLAMQDLGQVSVIIPKFMSNSLMNTSCRAAEGMCSQYGCHSRAPSIWVFIQAASCTATVWAAALAGCPYGDPYGCCVYATGWFAPPLSVPPRVLERVPPPLY
uniref:G-protein coupled receptors family 1 profile domain-containing protein n=1 Tax=Podarcis muralis TaxID=64176 RepID=A0A670JFW2_PODMU